MTEGAILDVKSLKPGPDAQSASVLYMSDQLRVQREAADLGFEGEGGKQRSFVIVMTSTDRRGVRPSANVANPEKGGADAVLHRDSRTGHWHIWSSAGEGEWVRIDQQRARDIAQNGIPEDIYE